MSIIPPAWRYKLAHHYLPEIITVILGMGAGAFGVSIIALPGAYERIPSFQQAFRFAPSQWWGLTMVVLAVLMVALLVHSRRAAAAPAFLLGIVWGLWVVPIAFSPNFAPSAPIIYTVISALTIVAGMACLVQRGETDGRT